MLEQHPELEAKVREVNAELQSHADGREDDGSEGDRVGGVEEHNQYNAREIKEFQINVEQAIKPMVEIISQAANADVALGLQFEPMSFRKKMQEVMTSLTQLQSLAKSYGRYDGGKRDLPAANLFTAIGIGLAMNEKSLITVELESDHQDDYFDVLTLRTDTEDSPGMSIPHPIINDRVTSTLDAQERVSEVDRPDHDRQFFHKPNQWKSRLDEEEEHYEPGRKHMMLVYHQELLRMAKLMGTRNLHNLVDLVFQHEVSESQDSDVESKDRYPAWHNVHVLIDQLEPYLKKMQLGMEMYEATDELLLKRTAGERYSGFVKQLIKEGSPSLSEKVKRMFRHVFSRHKAN